MKDFFDAFAQNPGTNAIAAGATVSPFWLPFLQGTSDIASIVLPILGVLWLLLQMYFFLRKNL